MDKLFDERIDLVDATLTFIGVTDEERKYCGPALHQAIDELGAAIHAIKEVDSDITGECSEQLIMKIFEHLKKY